MRTLILVALGWTIALLTHAAPQANNSTESGRAQNRRMVLVAR